jgi:hypothetical protein
MKYVINKCCGGFGISNEAFEWLIENKNWKLTEYNKSGHGYKDPTAKIVKCDKFTSLGKYYLIRSNSDLSMRCDPDIVECVETLGKKANGRCADLDIVECPLPPDSNILEISEYDGIETLQSVPQSGTEMPNPEREPDLVFRSAKLWFHPDWVYWHKTIEKLCINSSGKLSYWQPGTGESHGCFVDELQDIFAEEILLGLDLSSIPVSERVYGVETIKKT